MSTSKFEQQLESYYEQHRNQQLTSQLEDAVRTMRETLLLGAKYEELSDGGEGENADFSPGVETAQKVKRVKEAWEANRFDHIEDQLPELQKALDEEEQRVRGKIQGIKHDLNSHLQGLKALNQRINRVQPDRIRVVEEELERLDDVTDQSDQPFADQEQTTRQHIRQNVVGELENIEDDLMGKFRDSGAEKHVRSLISGGSVQLSSLSNEEIDELQGSLGTHLSITLRGE